MKTGFVAGAFDLLHAGHLHLLKECKKRCDFLVVGLHVDPSRERPEKNKPIESLLERQKRLDACKYVDRIVCYETEEELSILLKYGSFDIRFLGSDYNGVEKKNITEPNSIPIEIIKSLPIHTAEIRQRIKNS